MNSIKQNITIGIHVRSIYQTSETSIKYTNTIYDRLCEVEQQLKQKYKNYTIFIASDVNLYIDECKKIFGKNIQYLNFINRINNEKDSVPQLEQYKGFKLGSDILYECLALSLCDEIYISNSNIPFIITMINPNAVFKEY